MIGPNGPSGKCRTAQLVIGPVLPAAAADEAEQREDDQDNDDDPEDAHSSISFQRGARRKRASGCFGCEPTASAGAHEGMGWTARRNSRSLRGGQLSLLQVTAMQIARQFGP
jgi:hypothetical protein